jgi:hypothetical protein
MLWLAVSAESKPPSETTRKTTQFMSPLKVKLQTLAKEMRDHANRAEESAKTHALAHLRTPNSTACRDDAMKADGRADAYRGAATIIEDASRGID